MNDILWELKSGWKSVLKFRKLKKMNLLKEQQMIGYWLNPPENFTVKMCNGEYKWK